MRQPRSSKVRGRWLVGDRPERLAQATRHLGVALGVGATIALGYGIAFWHLLPAFPGDTLTYYLAGMRLNDGGYLYDLRPQDVWHYDRPEFPLYGPPLIAVIWRPLVAVLGPWSVVVWLVAMTSCAIWAAIYSLLATRGWSGALLIALSPSFVLLVGVGNVDCFVLAGLFLVWTLVKRGNAARAGLLLGLLVSLKLTPGALLVWLVATRRWRTLAWACGAIVVLAIVAMAGTTPDIWVRYARVIIEASQAGHATAWAVILVGSVLVLAVGARSERLAFGMAVAMMPFGSPQAAGHSWSLLTATVAPAGVTPTPARVTGRSPAADQPHDVVDPATVAR